jgi:predicted short-subunit dehydrogenase-like oxidoreductase (DUF2520 family)
MQWIPDINTKVYHLAFEVFGQHIWEVHHDLKTMVASFVTQELFIVVESLVKNQCMNTFQFIALFCMFFRVPT